MSSTLIKIAKPKSTRVRKPTLGDSKPKIQKSQKKQLTKKPKNNKNNDVIDTTKTNTNSVPVSEQAPEQTQNRVQMELSTVQIANLNMGYCCINVYLREDDIFCSRTCRLDTIKKRSIEYSYELAKKNLNDLATIFKWNHDNNIFLYRMSSEMFPFATHPDFYKNYDIEIFREQLIELGNLAREYKQTITFHPGQYNQLTSLRESVIEKSIIDIDFHAKILDMMSVDQDGVIVIHGGGKAGGKNAALDRFRESFKRLSPSSQRRLVLENCEMAYAIEDLLPISEELNIPIVIDYHHHNINPGTENLEQLTEKVLRVWKRRDITPLFHLSESRTGVLITDTITARRAHSNYIEILPEALLKILEIQRINLDIEAKMKEQAVLKLFKVYSITQVNEQFIINQFNQGTAEEESSDCC